MEQTVPSWLRVEAVSELLEITPRGVRQRIARDGWETREVPAPHGGRAMLEVAVSSLPMEAQQRLAEEHAASVAAALQQELVEAQLKAEMREAQERRRREAEAQRLATLSPAARARMAARLWALDALAPYIQELGQVAGREAFADALAAGDVDVPREHRKEVGAPSARTLQRWQRQRAEGGPARLGGTYGKGGRESAITEDNVLGRFVVAQLAQRGRDVRASVIRDGARAMARAGALEGLTLDEVPSTRTFQRYLSWLEAERPLVWANLVTPHTLRGTVMPAFGRRDEGVNRLNQLWELDSTLADVVVDAVDPISGEARSIRYHLLACVDVYTRRARLLVSDRSRAVAVASLLRRCILEWGVPQQVKLDNGKDYASNHVMDVLAALEIGHSFCTPFSPHEKPYVERFIQAFQHDVFALLPGYTGHDVAGQQNMRARRQSTAAGPVALELGEVNMTPEELQAFADDWCVSRYEMREHSALGMSPAEAAKEAARKGQRVQRIRNERALDHLLAPVAGRGGLKTVQKRGIQHKPVAHLAGSQYFYIAGALAARVGEQVVCREDVADIGRLFVYDADGAFITIAECPELVGIEREQVARMANREWREEQKRIKQLAREAKRQFSADEVRRTVMEQALEDSGRLRHLTPSEDHETPALDAGAEAAKALAHRNRKAEGQEASAEDEAAAARFAEEAERRARREAERERGEARLLQMTPRRLWRTEHDRYLDIQDRLARGVAVSDADLEWHDAYEARAAGRTA